jgi:hypothetical protein
MSDYYYKIVPIEDTESIIEKGLISANGEIYVSDILEQLPLIANSQLGIFEYSTLKINSKGITGKIMSDNVAEIGSGHQFFIKQSLIEPKHIEHIEDTKWNKWDLEEYCTRRKNNIIGMDDESSTGLIECMVRISPEWCEHYNNKYNKTLEVLMT